MTTIRRTLLKVMSRTLGEITVSLVTGKHTIKVVTKDIKKESIHIKITGKTHVEINMNKEVAFDDKGESWSDVVQKEKKKKEKELFNEEDVKLEESADTESWSDVSKNNEMSGDEFWDRIDADEKSEDSVAEPVDEQVSELFDDFWNDEDMSDNVKDGTSTELDDIVSKVMIETPINNGKKEQKSSGVSPLEDNNIEADNEVDIISNKDDLDSNIEEKIQKEENIEQKKVEEAKEERAEVKEQSLENKPENENKENQVEIITDKGEEESIDNKDEEVTETSKKSSGVLEDNSSEDNNSDTDEKSDIPSPDEESQDDASNDSTSDEQSDSSDNRTQDDSTDTESIEEISGDNLEEVKKPSKLSFISRLFKKKSKDDDISDSQAENATEINTDNSESTNAKSDSTNGPVEEKPKSEKTVGIKVTKEDDSTVNIKKLLIKLESDSVKAEQSYYQSLGLTYLEAKALCKLTELEEQSYDVVVDEESLKKKVRKRGNRIVKETDEDALKKKRYRDKRKRKELKETDAYENSEVGKEEERLNKLFNIWVSILTVVFTCSFVLVVLGVVNNFRVERLNEAQGKYDSLVEKVDSMHYPFCTNPIKSYATDVSLCGDNVYRFNTKLSKGDLSEFKGSSTKIENADDFKVMLDKFTDLPDDKKSAVLNEYNKEFFNENTVECLIVDQSNYDIGYISGIEVDSNAEVTINEVIGTVYGSQQPQDLGVSVYLMSFSKARLVPSNFHIKFTNYDDGKLSKDLTEYKQQIDFYTISLDKIKDSVEIDSKGE